jgi:hypothetical protein
MECGAPAYASPVAGAGFLAEAASRVTSRRPRPDAELTPEELKAREEAHTSAVALGKRDHRVTYLPPGGEHLAEFYFLEDGHYAFGAVWYRGQEVAVDLDGPRGQEAREMLAMGDFEQMAIFGIVKWRQGRWPGASYAEGEGQYERLRSLSRDGPQVEGPSADQLSAAERAERARGRAVPAPSLR